MAVIQISKIQVRRGLQENLPQLAGGEFGWSVDERRLWIGNGTLSEGAPEEGNTEILTSRSDVLQAIESYIFRGTESGYTSRTGPNILGPVTRTLQEKFDDIVNFRDFITDADAASGDYTTALQRAIDQVFPLGYDDDSEAGVRRILRIPAGKWQISNVTIPPYATLQGEGKHSTILYGNIATSSLSNGVLEVRDNQGNVGTLVNTLTSQVPSNVKVSGLTVQNTTGANLVVIQSARNVTFDDCAFIGSNSAPFNFNTISYGVGLGDTVEPVKNITLKGCTFKNTHFGLIALGQATNVTASDCIFDTLTVAVYGQGSGYAPQMRVTNSYFSNIAQSAIGSIGDSSIISAFNFYDRVGYGDGTVMDSGVVEHPVFEWNGPANHSIHDVVARTFAQENLQPIYRFANAISLGTYTSHSASGSTRTTSGYITEITDGAVVASQIEIPKNHSAVIDYRIERSDGVDLQSKIGTVKITHLNGSTFYDDEYTETATIGVDLSYSTSGNNLVVSFDATSTGQNAVASYSAKFIF